MAISDSLLQVKRYAAVGLSWLLRQVEAEKRRNDRLAQDLKGISDTMHECDKATTMSPA